MHLRRSLRERRHEDQGLSLVEVLISMALFSVVVAVAGAGVVLMVNDLRRTTNQADASDSVRKVFTLLDQQLRAAQAVNMPGRVGGASYLEFQVRELGGVLTCHQWRLVTATSTIQQRSWRSPITSGPAWQSVATGISGPADGSSPFVFLPATVTQVRQGVTLRLTATKGRSTNGGRQQVTQDAGLTLIARNTSMSTATNSDSLVPGVSDSPVCLGAGRS